MVYFLISLASNYSEKGLFRLARHYINEAIKLNPENYYGYQNRARIFDREGQYPQALLQFDEAKKKTRKQAWFSLGKWKPCFEWAIKGRQRMFIVL